MGGDTQSRSGARGRPYGPYGPPYGVPFAWPYARRPIPVIPYGPRFFGPYAPFGVPYSKEAARKQELEALRAQAEYLEDVLNDTKSYIAELEGESEEQ